MGVVAYHTDVLPDGRQLPDDEVLAKVGVLELVDKQVMDAVLVFVEHIEVLLEKLIRIEQQIVEIHGPRLKATQGIVFINVADFRSHVGGIITHHFDVGEVFLPGDELVFCRGNAVINNIGFVLRFVKPHFFDNRPDQ